MQQNPFVLGSEKRENLDFHCNKTTCNIQVEIGKIFIRYRIETTVTCNIYVELGNFLELPMQCLSVPRKILYAL